VNFAKAAGCNGLTLTGRAGWVKALQDLGFAANGLRYVMKEFDE
jgi:tagatose-1,6-bisphosphate aldolase